MLGTFNDKQIGFCRLNQCFESEDSTGYEAVIRNPRLYPTLRFTLSGSKETDNLPQVLLNYMRAYSLDSTSLDSELAALLNAIEAIESLTTGSMLTLSDLLDLKKELLTTSSSGGGDSNSLV